MRNPRPLKLNHCPPANKKTLIFTAEKKVHLHLHHTKQNGQVHFLIISQQNLTEQSKANATLLPNHKKTASNFHVQIMVQVKEKWKKNDLQKVDDECDEFHLVSA